MNKLDDMSKIKRALARLGLVECTGCGEYVPSGEIELELGLDRRGIIGQGAVRLCFGCACNAISEGDHMPEQGENAPDYRDADARQIIRFYVLHADKPVSRMGDGCRVRDLFHHLYGSPFVPDFPAVLRRAYQQVVR